MFDFDFSETSYQMFQRSAETFAMPVCVGRAYQAGVMRAWFEMLGETEFGGEQLIWC